MARLQIQSIDRMRDCALRLTSKATEALLTSGFTREDLTKLSNCQRLVAAAQVTSGPLGMKRADIVRAMVEDSVALSSVADGRAVPFVIEDDELVTAALNSKIRGNVYPEDLKLPFDEMLVQVPKLRSTARGSEWDLVYIANREAGRMNPETMQVFETRQVFMVAMFRVKEEVTGEFSRAVSGGYIALDKCAYISETEIKATTEYQGTMPEAPEIMIGIKLAMFLSTMEHDIEIITRDIPKKGPPMVRKAYRRYHSVRVKLSDIQKRYEQEHGFEESDEDEPENDDEKRRVSVRHRVRGHYKHYKKGKPVRWCPPHWRGPLGGPTKRTDYVVEA